jgi:DHA1 family bicyclomycin/chloramphenicol resistance-like MFS transporter
MPTPSAPTPPLYSRPKLVFLIFYILFMQMFSMFSTDMYNPALPGMVENLHTTETLVNATIAIFFLFMMVGTLIFGPISDKIGRRPLLIAGSALYAVASAACAFSPNIYALLVARSVQAIAAGMAQVVGTAIVKDLFEGKMRENVLMVTQAFFVLGPILAPLIGGQILIFTTWRAIFVLLIAFGVINVILSCFFKESLPVEERHTGSVLSSLSGLIDVAKSRTFVLFMMATMAFAALPFNTYLIGSSHIYETHFGFTPQQFSLIFGANAALSTCGLLLLKLAQRFIGLKRLTTVLQIVTLAAGVVMVFAGPSYLWCFFPAMLIFNMACVIVRPYSMNILFEMRARDIGSAASFMGVAYSVMGLVGMIPVLLGADYIISLGVLIVLGVIVSGACWIAALRSGETIPRITEE